MQTHTSGVVNMCAKSLHAHGRDRRVCACACGYFLGTCAAERVRVYDRRGGWAGVRVIWKVLIAVECY